MTVDGGVNELLRDGLSKVECWGENGAEHCRSLFIGFMDEEVGYE